MFYVLCFMVMQDPVDLEVKYKADLEDASKSERKFNNFKKLFPIYNDYKFYGAMASFYFPFVR